jgi:spore coat protein U-like protein
MSLIKPLFFAALLLVPMNTSVTLAVTTSSTMAVSATVAALCTVTAQPLAFGAYTSAQTDATSTVSVTCTNGTSYAVALDAGATSGATTANRLMTGPGGATLRYVLFNNASYTTNWGSIAGTDTLASLGTGVAQTLTVYGRIPAGQYPTPGAYTDSVTVTLTY